MTARAVVLLLLIGSNATAQNGGPTRASGQNSVADFLQERALALGIDFDKENAKASHPAKEDLRALSEAGPGPWLNSEIERADDSISEPSAALREYLRGHRETIWNIVAALEKNAPDWGHRSDEMSFPIRILLPTVGLEKILLATALVEEREGRALDAERVLEASWSLGRPLSQRLELLSQLVSISVEKWRAGILRKMQEAPLSWMGRLAEDDPSARMLDALVAERWDDPSGLKDPFMEILRKAKVAIVDSLRKISPCDLAGLTDDDVWRFASGALSAERSEIRGSLQEIWLPNALSAVRRAARLSVDRELTLEVLRLRLEKKASREDRWPAELRDAASTVCPGTAYSYRCDRAGMEIRFEGAVDVPSSGPVLPLEFRSGSMGDSTATQTPAPTATPTPEAP